MSCERRVKLRVNLKFVCFFFPPVPKPHDLLDVCDPEYHAAASVVLMTTSTGTRSATASLAALIVRRIPLPACSQRSRQLISDSRSGSRAFTFQEKKNPGRPQVKGADVHVGACCHFSHHPFKHIELITCTPRLPEQLKH